MTLRLPQRRQTALIAEFRARFEESVALHLRSDVPVGTCLSGGPRLVVHRLHGQRATAPARRLARGLATHL